MGCTDYRGELSDKVWRCQTPSSAGLTAFVSGPCSVEIMVRDLTFWRNPNSTFEAPGWRGGALLPY